MDGRTDGRTDGPTDRLTHSSYRDAWTHLKMEKRGHVSGRQEQKKRKKIEEKRKKIEEKKKGNGV